MSAVNFNQLYLNHSSLKERVVKQCRFKSSVFLFVLTLIMCLSGVQVIQAQPKSESEVKWMIENMKSRIKLSASQQQKIEVLADDAVKKVVFIYQEFSEPKVIERKLEDIRDEFDVALLEVLSAVQWRDWMDYSNNFRKVETKTTQ